MKEVIDTQSAVNEHGDVVPLDDVFPGEGLTNDSVDELEAWAEYEASREETAVTTLAGAAIGIAERLNALEALSGAYGKVNGARGFGVASKVDPFQKDINKRYSNPSEIAGIMAKKTESSREVIDENLSILAATDQLKAAGFSPEAVGINTLRTEAEIRDGFGEGTKQPERARRIRKVEKMVKAVHKELSTKDAA